MIEKCIECGSKEFIKTDRDIVLSSGNPSFLVVNSECTECKTCGKKYYDDNQTKKLSDKVKLSP